MSNETLPYIGEVETLSFDGLQIRMARHSGPSGMPAVVFSPWPESIYGLRALIPVLAAKGPVLAVDLPGFGLSQSRSDLLSPQSMSDFICRLADHLGIERMHAIGPDIGTLALLFAVSQRPLLFESLVLGSGGTSLSLVGSGLNDLIQSPVGAFVSMEGGDLALGFIKQAADRPIPAAVLEDYRNSSAGNRFENATNFVRAYIRDLPVLEKLLPNIATPSLIISSTKDNMVPPANGTFLAERLPHSRHVVLEGGHLIWEDAAEAYGELAVNWISGDYRAV